MATVAGITYALVLMDGIVWPIALSAIVPREWPGLTERLPRIRRTHSQSVVMRATVTPKRVSASATRGTLERHAREVRVRARVAIAASV